MSISVVIRMIVSTAALAGLALLGACSVPNLESPECTAARGTVKEFYSNHFGNDMRFSAESLKPKEKFLTRSLLGSLPKEPSDSDPFTTNSPDLPKAFRVGGCTLDGASKARLEVLLFWRDDTRTEERKIHAEVVKVNDKWLIDKVLY